MENFKCEVHIWLSTYVNQAVGYMKLEWKYKCGNFQHIQDIKTQNWMRTLTRKDRNKRERAGNYQQLAKEWSGDGGKCEVIEAVSKKCLTEQNEVCKKLSSGWVRLEQKSHHWIQRQDDDCN